MLIGDIVPTRSFPTFLSIILNSSSSIGGSNTLSLLPTDSDSNLFKSCSRFPLKLSSKWTNPTEAGIVSKVTITTLSDFIPRTHDNDDDQKTNEDVELDSQRTTTSDLERDQQKNREFFAKIRR